MISIGPFLPTSAFQSTRPVRGRDGRIPSSGRINRNFNPRAPCGGATHPVQVLVEGHGISIHAPRAGARLVRYYGPDYDNLFQSTRPVRGRDLKRPDQQHTE